MVCADSWALLHPAAGATALLVRRFIFLLGLTLWGFAQAFFSLFRKDQVKHDALPRICGPTPAAVANPCNRARKTSTLSDTQCSLWQAFCWADLTSK